MNTLTCVESIKNIFDLGVVIEAVKNLKEKGLEMNFGEFAKYLFFGEGYHELTPPQLTEKMKKSVDKLFIIDLRETKKHEKNSIEGAISLPFDDLLRSVLVDQKFTEYLDKEIILVCDTGQKSRVAGSILAEEGFKKIYNLKGGMRRWNRWQKLLSFYNNLKCKQLLGCPDF